MPAGTSLGRLVVAPTLLVVGLWGAPCHAVEPSTLLNGDVNCDAHLDISDAVTLLAYLYLGAGPPCPLADRPETVQRIVVLESQVAALHGEVVQLEGEVAGKESDLRQAAD